MVDKKAHRILMVSALLEFFAALLGFIASEPALSLLFLSQAIVFLVLDRLGIPAVELGIDGSTYRIYPSWGFSGVVVEGEERRAFPLLLGKNTIKIHGKVIEVYLVPRRFFPAVFVEFEGKKIKLI